MSHLAQRLRLLNMPGHVPAGEAARVLVATFRFAAASERDAIASALLNTRDPQAVVAVLCRAHLLSEATLGQLCKASLDEPLRLVMNDRDPAAVCNSLDVISELGDPNLLEHVLDAIQFDDRDVRERAGKALLTIVVGNIGESGRRRVPNEISRVIDQAVSLALESFPKHRQRAALVAATIASAKPGPQLSAIHDAPASPAAQALRSIVSDFHDPIVRRNLIRWIGLPALSRQITRLLNHVRRPEWLGDVLASGHLLRSPDRRRAMRALERPLRCIPSPEFASTLSPRAQRWMPDWIGSMGIKTTKRVERLADVLLLSDPLARLRAVRQLESLGSANEAALAAIEPFCLDNDPSVARCAIHALSSLRRPGDFRLLERVGESGMSHAGGFARSRLGHGSAADFFVYWMQYNEPLRMACACRVLEHDRKEFLAGLRRHLPARTRNESLAAISIVRKLRLVDQFDEEMLLLTSVTDPYVAAAAVLSLAPACSPRRAGAARAALQHPDPRVWANAVEVIALLKDPSLLDLVAPLAKSRRNRGRANAIRAMLEAKPDLAERHLKAMLLDRDPLHRVSALWVASRSRLPSIVDDVTALASNDEYEPIRTRAGALRRSMLLNAKARCPVARAMETTVACR